MVTQLWKIMKNIFTYANYRDYLHDFYLEQKSSKPSFSYRHIAAIAGINSSGFYPLVIQGKRNLTGTTIKKTCVALELNPQESEFFRVLVLFNQAKTLRKKNGFFTTLVKLRNEKNIEIVTEQQYDIFSQWYHGAVRELAVCRDFKNDFRKLGRMLIPAITEKQARESVELLLRLGFLKKADGRYAYAQSSPIITTGQDIKAHQVINYQVQMLKLAIESFNRFGPNDRLFTSSTTLRVSKATYEMLKQKNRDHRRELLKIAEADKNADQVYQLNINMFPLSNLRYKGEKHA
jgi:uncharacterized protein (TIGR02147 family)